MNVSRRQIAKALMRPFVIVQLEVAFQAGGQSRHGSVFLDVNVFVLHGAPEAFDEDVVKGATTAVHADPNVGCFQGAGKVKGRELNALVGVKDVGLGITQGNLKRGQAKGTVQSVGELPGQDKATEPIHDGHQIHEASRHRNIGYVGAPDLVGSGDGQTTQQIGIFFVLFVAQRRAWPGIDCLQTHLAHQAGYPLAIDLEAMSLVEPGCYLAIAVEGRSGVLFVDQPHEMQIQGRFSGRLPVVGRPVETDQLALPANTQGGMVRFNHRPFGLNRIGQLFFSATPVPS